MTKNLIYVYLTLPIFIFWWGWFAWWVALPCSYILMCSVFQLFSNYFQKADCKSATKPVQIANLNELDKADYKSATISAQIANLDEQHKADYKSTTKTAQIANLDEHDKADCKSATMTAQITNLDELKAVQLITHISPLITITLAFLWTYFSGIGDFRPQHFDYYKHNLIINNLVRLDWPVVYADGQYLCYNLAYYLVPTLLAKFFGGLSSVGYFVFGWSWIGLFLLFQFLNQKGGLKLVLFFIFFNSIEAVFYAYDFLRSPLGFYGFVVDLFTKDHNIELIKTAGGLKYLSPVKLISSAPQHAIGTWLCTALLVDNFEKLNLNKLCLLFAILLYWSPLAAFGLGLLVVIYFLLRNHSPKSFLQKIREIYTALPLHLITLLVPAFFYFSGHIPIKEINGLIFNDLHNLHHYSLLILFLFANSVFWLILFLYVKKRIETNLDYLTIASIIVLFLLPFYHFGNYNDLMIRANIPAIFIVCYRLFPIFDNQLNSPTEGLKPSAGLKLLTTIILLTIISIPVQNQLKWFTEKPYFEITTQSVSDFGTKTIHELNIYHEANFNAANQYLGRKESFYWRYFSNK